MFNLELLNCNWANYEPQSKSQSNIRVGNKVWTAIAPQLKPSQLELTWWWLNENESENENQAEVAEKNQTRPLSLQCPNWRQTGELWPVLANLLSSFGQFDASWFICHLIYKLGSKFPRLVGVHFYFGTFNAHKALYSSLYLVLRNHLSVSIRPKVSCSCPHNRRHFCFLSLSLSLFPFILQLSSCHRHRDIDANRNLAALIYLPPTGQLVAAQMMKLDLFLCLRETSLHELLIDSAGI